MADRLETTILKGLLYNEEYTRKVLPFLDASYFHDTAEKHIYEQINKYLSKYNASPTIEALNIEIAQSSCDNEDAIQSVIGDLTLPDGDSYKSPNESWFLEQTEKFCQEKAIYNAIMNSIEIMDGKDKKRTKESIPGLLSDALGVSFDTNVGHDYLEDSDDRFEFYHRKENHFPFDLEYFDKITNGGLVTKTLNVFMAGPGVGKTLAMCHFAATYLTKGLNVLYVTLEMAEERISERIDANLLNVSLDDLYSLPKDLYDKKIERLRRKTAGKLIVKEFPTAQAGVGHFRHLLNELLLKKNFKPDVLFVDYINICASSRFKMGANVNSYTYIKSIAEELRGFAVEQQFPVITATQVNREGYGNSDMGMENTAESFGLPATADLFLALITSEEMEKLGQIMVKQLKNRYNDPTKNRRFVIGVDRAKMRLFDVDQSAQEDIAQEDSGFDGTPFGKRLSKDYNSIQV